MNVFTVRLPWPARELSPNVTAHWGAESRAKKKYRSSCFYATRAVMASLNSTENIRLSFIFNPPHNRKYDKDNLIAQMKSGIDGIADALGVDDQYFDIGSIELGQRVVEGEVLVSIEW